MRLRDRLAHLPQPPAMLGREDTRLSTLKAELARRGEKARTEAQDIPDPLPPGSQAVPLSERPTAQGPVRFVEHLFAADATQGTVCLCQALRASSAHVAKLALNPALADIDLSGMLLLDTETTGLAGGCGTLPFLVGAAWFEEQTLRVEQYFVPTPGEEAPVLAALSERLQTTTCLVTYNGKSFDWPLLQTRFVLNRMPTPATLPHIDLLHLARRVFKRRMGGMRLSEVERHVLGFHRQGDVDSGQIPELYFSYLRGGGMQRLAPVFQHNALDVASLAALLAVIAQGFERPGLVDDPRDQMGYAAVAARAGDPARAVAFAKAAGSETSEQRLAVEAGLLAARVLRRRGEIEAAVTTLHQALKQAGEDETLSAPLHLMLAKLCEHRLGNLGQALAHAEHTGPCEGEPAQARRLQRLRRRLAARSMPRRVKAQSIDTNPR